MLATEQPRRKEYNRENYQECFEVARNNFARFPKAQLIRGKVPETLSQVTIDRVCYLSLDMNIVVPEMAAIEFFWDKLSPGAPVILDDYGLQYHEEQQRAMDTFAERKGVRIVTLPTGQGLLVKP
jgi:hypothetical protein